MRAKWRALKSGSRSAPQKVLDRGNILRDGTVPIAARVEGDGLMAAASAVIEMTAQCRGAAANDGIEHLAM
jgi:hypothetical protein